MNSEYLDEKEKEPVKIATILGSISIVLNIVLGVTKIIIGSTISSFAVLSDGIHSTGDMLSTIIAVISVWIAAKKKNKKYNYGYERYASIFTLILSVILFFAAFEILFDSTESLIESFGNEKVEQIEVYSNLWWVSLSLALASIFLKGLMFVLTLYGAKKAHSNAMKADAYHQIVDCFSSIAAVIALFGYLWLPENNFLDPIFTYPIAVMIVLIGVETFKTAARELSDHAIDDEKLEKVKSVVYQIVDIEHVKLIHSRIFSEKFYLNIYILQDEKMTLLESDAVADKIKEKLFFEFPDLKNVYVTIEPDDEKHRKQEEEYR